MCEAASSGLIVALTHDPSSARTPRRHDCLTSTSTLIEGRASRIGVAALLRIDRLAGIVRVLIDRLLHVAGTIQLLGHRIEHRLAGRRRLRRLPGRASVKEHNGQPQRRHIQYAHMNLVTSAREDLECTIPWFRPSLGVLAW